MASLRTRGKTYQIQYYVGGKQKRIGLGAIPLQLAKEKLRQFESAQARGDENPLPSKTPIPIVVQAYAEHVRAVKTPKSAVCVHQNLRADLSVHGGAKWCLIHTRRGLHGAWKQDSAQPRREECVMRSLSAHIHREEVTWHMRIRRSTRYV